MRIETASSPLLIRSERRGFENDLSIFGVGMNQEILESWAQLRLLFASEPNYNELPR